MGNFLWLAFPVTHNENLMIFSKGKKGAVRSFAESEASKTNIWDSLLWPWLLGTAVALSQ